MWEVIVVPTGKGVIVYVTDGKVRSVVGRVAYLRRESSRPLRTFKRSFRVVVMRAWAEANRLNSDG